MRLMPGQKIIIKCMNQKHLNIPDSIFEGLEYALRKDLPKRTSDENGILTVNPGIDIFTNDNCGVEMKAGNTDELFSMVRTIVLDDLRSSILKSRKSINLNIYMSEHSELVDETKMIIGMNNLNKLFEKMAKKKAA